MDPSFSFAIFPSLMKMYAVISRKHTIACWRLTNFQVPGVSQRWRKRSYGSRDFRPTRSSEAPQSGYPDNLVTLLYSISMFLNMIALSLVQLADVLDSKLSLDSLAHTQVFYLLITNIF